MTLMIANDPRFEGKNEENKKRQRGQQHIHSSLNRYLICSPRRGCMCVGHLRRLPSSQLYSLPRGGLEWTRTCINEVIAVPNCRSKEKRSSL